MTLTKFEEEKKKGTGLRIISYPGDTIVSIL